ncbi:MAG: prepilin peptidase [Enterocloster asparagiformis]|nr:prepilin peptidase [Enterocloster asparagiformis]
MQKNWLFLIYLAACAGWDMKTRRIPNWLAALGLAAGLAAAGAEGAAESIAALCRALAVTIAGLFLYRFRVIGAGDVKMAAVIAAWLGLERGCAGIFCGLFLGALWSLGRLLRRGMMKKRFAYLASYIKAFLETGLAPAYYRRERDGDEAAIPLGACLAAGAAMAAIAGLVRPFL